MSRPFFLYSLQKIDSKLDQHQNRIREIEAVLSNNAKMIRAEGKAQRTEIDLDKARKSLRNAEIKVKDQRLKIEQNESTLYSGKVRNPKELQDLQSEVAALKRFLEILEDRQLEAMLHLDEMENRHNSAIKVLDQVRSETKTLHGDLISEKANINNDIQMLEVERRSCLPDIIPNDLQIYDRLRKTHSGVAVAKVNDRSCSACGATLNAAAHQAARSPSQITHCETCDRVLYGT